MEKVGSNEDDNVSVDLSELNMSEHSANTNFREGKRVNVHSV